MRYINLHLNLTYYCRNYETLLLGLYDTFLVLAVNCLAQSTNQSIDIYLSITTIQIIVVPYVRNALYSWRKVRAL